MFENIIGFFKRISKKGEGKQSQENSKNAAKERLHLVLMQDRANVSADFLELMKQEIIDVIKKYIEIDEKEIDVRLTNKENEDGTNGAPALYANIPILNIKNDSRKISEKDKEKKQDEKIEKNEEENNINIEKQEDIENIEAQEDENKKELQEQNEKKKEKKEIVEENKEEVKEKAQREKIKSKETK